MASSLLTLAELKTWLKITVTTWDTVLQTCLDAADAMLCRFCCRPVPDGFIANEWIETFDGDDNTKLYLRCTPVTVDEDLTLTVGDGEAEAFDADGSFVVNATTGRVALKSTETTIGPGASVAGSRPRWGVGPSPCWPRGQGNVVVVYTGGYASNAVPEDLKQAMRTLATLKWSEYLNGSDHGLKSETLGAYSYTREAVDDATKRWQSQAQAFRRCAGCTGEVEAAP